MDEYVIVTYPTPRGVIVDDDPEAGQTDDLLIVSTGYHKFALTGNADYTPKPEPILIEGTTDSRPHVIAFIPRAPAASGI